MTDTITHFLQDLVTEGAPAPVAEPTTDRSFSDIRLLPNNVAAWREKCALIGEATTSIDAAYFILEEDTTTSKLLLDLIAAAERGVQVRLLVDYFLTWTQAPLLKALQAIEHIEVRRYGPPSSSWLDALRLARIAPVDFIAGLSTRNPQRLAQSLADTPLLPPGAIGLILAVQPEPNEAPFAMALRLVQALQRALIAAAMPTVAVVDDIGALWGNALTTIEDAFGTLADAPEQVRLAVAIGNGLETFLFRTHHKLLLADGRRFIMGGRNLADAYQRDDRVDARPFLDLDIHAVDAGPAPSPHVATFERLWDLTVSIVVDQDLLDGRPATPHAVMLARLQGLAGQSDHLDVGAPATVALPDLPGRLVDNGPSRAGDSAITRLYVQQIRAHTDRHGGGAIDLVNAYVFTGDVDGIDPSLRGLHASLLDAAGAGITVNLYTNSLKTTDLNAVNAAAYSRIRELVVAGVNVFELALPGTAADERSLHAKSAAIGDEWLIVGSYNLDPRSELYDTNNALVLHDLTGQATAAFRNARIHGTAWTPLTLVSVAGLELQTLLQRTALYGFRRLL